MMFVYGNCIIYYQTKKSIDFCCRQRLNFKYFIQPSNTLSNIVKLDDQNESRPKI